MGRELKLPPRRPASCFATVSLSTQARACALPYNKGRVHKSGRGEVERPGPERANGLGIDCLFLLLLFLLFLYLREIELLVLGSKI